MRPPGSQLNGRYVVEAVLGDSEFSATYLVRHGVLGRPAVIKELQLGALAPGEGEEFQRQAQALAQYHHPGLVGVIDFFEEDDCAYLVLDYTGGRPLQAWLDESNGPLEVNRVLDWTEQLVAVLDYLHSARPAVVFCQVRPENCIVDSFGTVQLMDFGVPGCIPEEEDPAVLSFTPWEQLEGTPDARADIYALGATMYTLLGGEAPPAGHLVFRGEERIRPLRTLNGKVSGCLEGIVMKMLHATPEGRYQNMSEVRAALQQRDVRGVSLDGTLSPPSGRLKVTEGGTLSPPSGRLRQTMVTQTAGAPPPSTPSAKTVVPSPSSPNTVQANRTGPGSVIPGVNLDDAEPYSPPPAAAAPAPAPAAPAEKKGGGLFGFFKKKEPIKPPEPPPERRRSRRYASVFQVMSPDLPNYRAMAQDISTGGIRLRADAEIPKARRLNLRLVFDDHGFKEVNVSGTVVWVQPDPNRGFNMGVAFDELAPADAQELGRYIELLHRLKGGKSASNEPPGRLV